MVILSVKICKLYDAAIENFKCFIFISGLINQPAEGLVAG